MERDLSVMREEEKRQSESRAELIKRKYLDFGNRRKRTQKDERKTSSREALSLVMSHSNVFLTKERPQNNGCLYFLTF